MNTSQNISADLFVDQVIVALTRADAAALGRLEAAAPSVSAPIDLLRYTSQRATLAALLDASARNLRLMRRAAGRRSDAASPHS
ncbi:MAG TPA: hypothetical protein VMD58_05080 [Acidobacteriaceae bacterium]|nr:hypothetical protein [Acidobacteriaceae bacterium]